MPDDEVGIAITTRYNDPCEPVEAGLRSPTVAAWHGIRSGQPKETASKLGPDLFPYAHKQR